MVVPTSYLKMSNVKKRANRGCNYTETERRFLLQLVHRYRETLENKATNVVCNRQKDECWQKVEALYNEVATSGRRDWKQLKIFYKNFKRTFKKTAVDNNSRYFVKLQEVHIPMDKADETKHLYSVEEKDCNGECGELLTIFKEEAKPLEDNYDDVAYLPAPPIPQEPTSTEFVEVPSVQCHSNEREKKPLTSEQLKRIYFKKKILNANLERKLMLKEHAAKMRLYKEQLKQASS